MKSYKNFILTSFVIFGLLLSIGCRKFLDVAPPIDRLTAEVVFADEQTAVSAVLGIYSRMMTTTKTMFSGAATIQSSLSSDELFRTNSSQIEELQFQNNSIQPNNSIIRADMWLPSYQRLYHVNSCLEKLNASTSLEDSIKSQLIGECKFLRAFIYFYLTNFYGDVPLITSSDYRTNSILPRTQMQKAYKLIIQDLNDAYKLLKVSYVGAGRVRPNRLAAAALLARVYLYVGDWNKAEQYSSEVIQSGSYSLTPQLNNVFLIGSNETIWQLMPVSSGFNTTEARFILPTTAATSLPQVAINPTLVSDWSTTDARRSAWTASKVVGSQTFHYPFKYKSRLIGTVTEYYVVLRLAELYLIRAEANTQLNKLVEASADINVIRNRAGLSNLSFSTQDQLATAILQERRFEFFAEWGHRWFDLKRTGKADAVLSSKAGWDTHDKLYPIPVDEIMLNPFLIQNPGY